MSAEIASDQSTARPRQARALSPEHLRLQQDARRERNWKRWGPYLAERQWATVREDYSANGDVWNYFPHDHARSRAYRWGEDGILGICDRECRLCFALALWNGRDPILKERLFGLTGPEGNHGEDVKECYYYLDSTPTYSYLKGLYKYPQAAYPYLELVEQNRRRGRRAPEFEILDTGVFDQGRYFDVFAEYAKRSPNDILIRLTVYNRGPEQAPLHLIPTAWFRNTWSWGATSEGLSDHRPYLRLRGPTSLQLWHFTLGRWRLEAEPHQGQAPEFIFTDNDTNLVRLYGATTNGGFVKDAFHEYVIDARSGSINPRAVGTKAAALYLLDLPPGGSATVRLRLFAEEEAPGGEPFGPGFDETFRQRIAEADAFYAQVLPAELTAQESLVARQAYAGLLWSRQFYHYVIKDWLEGDPHQPKPPVSRKRGRNSDWTHLYNRDVLSVPDKWEYPWYAAWDLAFHMLPMARVDPEFAKAQLVLLLREWYMHPNGQLPACEFNFSDVHPPVHAWACWRVYKITASRGQRDRLFLARTFQKLLINFTWWVNRKDITGRHIFAGGFLGLDNIAMFDRSRPLPSGMRLEQADGTAWMAFYCGTMLAMALELASECPEYEDLASKFFEHFVAITDAINTVGGTGLWNEDDGFYYDQIHTNGLSTPLRIRSYVGLVPLLAVEVLERSVIDRLPGFRKRMNWFLHNRRDLARFITYMEGGDAQHAGRYLLAIPSQQKLDRVLRYVLDENELLSPFGIRSLSRAHLAQPFVVRIDDRDLSVRYVPGESDTNLFGGNSNWRGPVWFCLNYLLIEALERYHHFYGEQFTVQCPSGSGRRMTLLEVARELQTRLVRLFLPDSTGRRPCMGDDPRYATDPYWADLLLFHEYFHGENGKGLGASHQTGWTSLVTRCLESIAQARSSGRQAP
ncbi:MGH1-like glycoside hydrolase domain-containing protein [Fontivita pretiosa]|uniref:MGH1-like glycoside hydrolase domain-containing protein n=1 Tax=Fontivita pretiosa TaxID=2989684 RepID=UPI003D17FC0A